MSSNILLHRMFSLVSVILLLTGCGGTSADPTAMPTLISATSSSTPAPTATTALPTQTPIPTAPPAPTPTASQNDMHAAAIAALHSVSKLSHRSESEIVFTDGKTVTTTIEFVPPDKKHFSDKNGEMIVVDNKVYNKGRGQDKWTELQMDATQISYPDFGIEDLNDIQSLGQENLEGNPTLIYKASTVNKATGTTYVLTCWIGQKDGLLYKFVNDGEVGSLDSSTGKMKK